MRRSDTNSRDDIGKDLFFDSDTAGVDILRSF